MGTKNIFAYISLLLIIVFLASQVYSLSSRLTQIEELFKNGRWGTICTFQDVKDGSVVYGSGFFTDKISCPDSSVPFKVFVKNDIVPVQTVNAVIPSPTPIASTSAQTKIPDQVESIEQQKAPRILTITDNIGNNHNMLCQWRVTHYECFSNNPKEITVSVAKNPKLIFTVESSDPNSKPLMYGFNYPGGCDWSSKNTCTTDLQAQALGVRGFNFFVRNDDAYGSIGVDANALLYYKIME